MDLDIKGLRVLVTAGAGGIGLAIARRFVGEGARVHVCDVDEMALAALADQILVMCSPRGRTISGQAVSICGNTQMLG